MLGAVNRKIMRHAGLIHRASYILVFNDKQQLFVHLRTQSKDLYPGLWDLTVGGVVQLGESYEESARRELSEELGITPKKLLPCFDHFPKTTGNKVWGRVFCCTHNGPFTLQPEEVAAGHFISLASAIKQKDKDSFTPDGVEILARYHRITSTH